MINTGRSSADHRRGADVPGVPGPRGPVLSGRDRAAAVPGRGRGPATADNTHQIAQRIAAESRIVYVDNDPPVVAHARQLLGSTPEGVAEYLAGDLGQPEEIIRAAAGPLDFGRPVALMLMGVMGHIDDGEAYPSSAGCWTACPPAVISCSRTVSTPPTRSTRPSRATTTPARSVPAAPAGTGRRVLRRPGPGRAGGDPGRRWHPDLGDPSPDADVVGGVARKPSGA